MPLTSHLNSLNPRIFIYKMGILPNLLISYGFCENQRWQYKWKWIKTTKYTNFKLKNKVNIKIKFLNDLNFKIFLKC